MKKGERRNSGEKQEEKEEAGGEKKERKTSQAFHRQVRLDHAGFFGALAAGAAEVPRLLPFSAGIEATFCERRLSDI